MFGNLLPFLMFGILLAAVLSKPLARLPWISLPVALVLLGFVSSEIWVAFGMDTGLRWQILRDLVFYLLLPILIFEAAINVDTRWLRREAVLIGLLSVPLLLVAAGLGCRHHTVVDGRLTWRQLGPGATDRLDDLRHRSRDDFRRAGQKRRRPARGADP
jgi:NhaP-type Na+/H+ or K+/H+ antiporter